MSTFATRHVARSSRPEAGARRIPDPRRSAGRVRTADVGHTSSRGLAMMLTFLTLLAGAALGGGVAAGLTALVVLAATALTVLAAANGVRAVGRVFETLGD